MAIALAAKVARQQFTSCGSALGPALVLLAAVAIAPAMAQAESAHDGRLKALMRLQQGGQAAPPQFIEDCLRDASSRVRAAAAQTAHVLFMRQPRVLRRLAVMAQVDDNKDVRVAAAAALRVLDPRAYAAKVSSQNPPPVSPPPRHPLRPRARYAVALPVGLAMNALRTASSFGGRAGLMIRWGDVESQLSMGFGALSLGLRARWLMLRFPIFTPYLSAGAVVSFNQQDAGRRESASVFWGGGLRAYIVPPIFIQVELAASYTVVDPFKGLDPEDHTRTHRRWAMPLIVEVGLEFWP